MFENILKIIKKYHDNKQYADYEFVIDICNIIIDNNNLSDYINGIYINNSFNGNNSRYLYTTNILEFNLYRLYKTEYISILNDNYYGFFNLIVLKTIIHELEHVNQELIKDTPVNNLERKLLILGDPTTYIKQPNTSNKLSLSKQINRLEWLKYRILYNKYYYYAPNERLAIIKSCIELYKIIEIDFLKESLYYEIFNKSNDSELDNIIKPYKLNNDLTNSPSLEYLSKLTYDNQTIIKNDISLYDMSLPKEERFLYGLALTKEEYKEKDEIKKILIKK